MSDSSDNNAGDDAHGGGETHKTTGAGEGQADAHGGDSPLLKFEPNVAFWTFVTFVILAVVLKKLAWGPILDNLDKREKAIRESLAEAEKARAEAAGSLEEQQRVLSEARREAQELLAKSRADAERAREAGAAKARDESDKIVAAGRAAIEQETRAAIQEVRTVAVDLALSASSKLLKSQITDAKSRELVTGYIRELEQRSPEKRA